jgi:signal transduction histidine kinase
MRSGVLWSNRIAMADWLAGHLLEKVCAGMLADTEVTLEALAAAVPPQTLNPIRQWAAAGCAVRNLSAKIQDCAMRISSLITAVKGFTHMDQANLAEPLPLGPRLEHTVAVLGAKAHEKSASVTLELQAELPKVRGSTAELNQVWGSLIDNALDAVAKGGRVHVTAACDGRSVEVRIVDDGPGIRAEIRDRIFDPFFTTKPQGQGIGPGPRYRPPSGTPQRRRDRIRVNPRANRVSSQPAHRRDFPGLSA